MADYLITTESTSDLAKEIYEEQNVRVIRMEYMIDGGEPQFDEMTEASAFAMFRKMREGSVVTTALVSTARFLDFWRPLLAEGFDILHICFSSALSGTYNCALAAAEELSGEFPARSIYVVDSRGASGGQGLLVLHAATQKHNGLSLLACRDFAESQKLTVEHLFTVDDLVYLRRGGRVSAAAAAFGTLLSIKPAMDMDFEGHLVPREKVKGRLASIKWIRDHFLASYDPALNPYVIICHADCLDDAERLKAMLLAELPDLDVRFSFIGAIIGAHSGPGTLALFFRGNGRR